MTLPARPMTAAGPTDDRLFVIARPGRHEGPHLAQCGGACRCRSVASISLLGHPPIGKLRSSGKGLEVRAALVEGLHPTGGVVDDRDALIGPTFTPMSLTNGPGAAQRWIERPTVGRFSSG